MFEDIKSPEQSGPDPAPDTPPTKPKHKHVNAIGAMAMSSGTKKKPKRAHFQRFATWWRHLNRNIRFAIVSTALLIFAAGAIGFFYLTRPSAQTSIAITKRPKPAPTTVASPLTGIQVAPELAKRPVTGIMIENSTDARPQSGIQDAGVVFEAIAEGGITRFLTLYQEAQPQYIGPVRSLRPYYIDWAASFDASIAHIGGSPDALSQIRSGGKDLDQFFNAGSYWRQPSRPSPHNVYTSFEKLDALNKAKGYTSSTFTPWPRKKDQPLATPTAKSIDINISSYFYNSHYDYDAKTNSYLRFEGGAPHIATTSAADTTGQQLHPKVVLALVMPYSISSDGQHSVYNTYGSGGMYVFQDGEVVQGTWAKANRAGQFSFTDASGAPIKLDAGQTWAVAVANAGMVAYRP